MYEAFINNYQQSGVRQHDEKADFVNNFYPEIANLFSECGGMSFCDGLYKVHTIASSLHWALLIPGYFSKFAAQIIPISYDWMGRHFCIRPGRKDSVLMVDPSTAGPLEIPRDIVSFHNELLVENRDDVLSDDTFNQLRDLLQIHEVKYTDCLGYKVPLFLGGRDDVKNYEVSDMEVYWEFQKQLFAQIKELPEGTRIGKVTFQKGQ